MTALQLLEELEKRGIETVVDGSDLVVSPANRLDPDLCSQLRELKLEILEALNSKRTVTSERLTAIDEATVTEMEGLVRALGAEVETPVGRGRLVYLTPNGAVVQTASGLMYLLDPRKVRP